MTASDPANLAVRLDRITFLLVAVVVLQLVDVLGLGVTGLAAVAVLGLFVTALYSANAIPSNRR